MPAMGNNIHEEELDKFVKELESQGYRIIKLNGKSPDGVAVRVHDGELEISAVEALGSVHTKGKGWTKGWTWKKKRAIYSMFDNVLIHVFKRDPNVSRSMYCNFRRCARTEIISIDVMNNTLYFCERHMDDFKNETLASKTEFVYWCADYLKKSIFRTLNKT